ncbi:DsbA family protein [Candidatus Chloroploca asiatica]|uniref:DsbA family protein n=1 Tax=Candidatus Chloroploca asiatica TaxID=1506545 RepID=UPI001FEBDDF8|nr:thioredoxin domain-containing protein [Candidatus Chloroploca asiatica]
MKRFSCWMLLVFVLTACGSYAPPETSGGTTELRQTSVALNRPPTIPPLPPGPTPTPRPALTEIFDLRDDDPRALGDPNAPVLIVEFTDFECTFCQRFFQETRPQILSELVETGKVRLVVRDLPLTTIHPSALVAAVAANCAADQGQFFPMYERLFSSHQQEWGGVPQRDRVVFGEFADQLGLDGATFRACLDDPESEKAVLNEMQAALALGINSTPNFVINGQLVRGAQPYRVFEELVNQQ